MYFMATLTAEFEGEQVSVSTSVNPGLATYPDYKEYIRIDLKHKLGLAIVAKLEERGRAVYREERTGL